MKQRCNDENDGGGFRGFYSLFVTQFQGAFSDNTLKFLVIFMILNRLPEEQALRLVPVVGAVFALPFIIFSMTAGFLADRYSKRTMAIITKVAEIVTMVVACLGLQLSHIPLLVFCIFIMSTQSAFFGPTKYGLLPELLPVTRLSWGNGVLSFGTFTAIITGTALAGVLSDTFGDDQSSSGVVLIGLALFGTLTSLGIDRVRPANPNKRFNIRIQQDFFNNLRIIRSDPVLCAAIVCNTYFWALGSLIQPNIVFYGSYMLNLSDTQTSLLQAMLAIGIAIGSVAAGWISGKKIEYRLIPIGGGGLILTTGLLAQALQSGTTVGFFLWALGFFSGFVIVPVNAAIQHRPEAGERGAVIATSALFSWSGILAASGLYYILTSPMGMEPNHVFLTASLATAAAFAYGCYLASNLGQTATVTNGRNRECGAGYKQTDKP